MSSNNKFQPIVVEQDGEFCVYLPELDISGEGRTIESAYEEYRKQLKNIEERQKKFGLANLVTEPYPPKRNRLLFKELGLFWLKALSGSILFIFVS